MILELADGPGRYNRQRPRAASSQVRRRRPVVRNSGANHIYLPPHYNNGRNGLWVREDKFDHLNDADWSTLMDDLLDHQPGMADLSSKAKRAAKKAAKQEKKAKRTARKDDKKATKAKKKKDKNERKNTRVNSRAEKRRAKGQSSLIKAQAKQDKANRPSGGDDDDSGDSSSAMGIFNKVVDKAAGAYQKFKGGGPAPDDDSQPDDAGADDPTGGNGGGGSKPPKQPAGSDDTILGMPKPVAYGVGALAVAGIGFAIYKATSKKKRK